MRSLYLSLTLSAALGVAVLTPGLASAQPASTYSRPNYYTPSNYGTPAGGGYYRPSTFGAPRTSYGMPNPASFNQTPLGPISAATPVPVYALPALGNPLNGAVPPPSQAPPVVNPDAANEAANVPAAVAAPAAALVSPGAEVPANGAAPAPGSPDAAAAAVAPTAVATSVFAPGYAFSTGTTPSYYEGYSARPYVSLPRPYSGPQYSSSFYEPLRKVYGSSER